MSCYVIQLPNSLSHQGPWLLRLETYCFLLCFLLLLFFLSVTHEVDAEVLRNHRSNDLGVWYDDRSMYLVVHKGLKYSSGYILRSINSWCLLKNSMGNFFLQEKNIFWSDCNEISQE